MKAKPQITTLAAALDAALAAPGTGVIAYCPETGTFDHLPDAASSDDDLVVVFWDAASAFSEFKPGEGTQAAALYFDNIVDSMKRG